MTARSEQGSFLDGVLDALVDTILAFGSVWTVLTMVVTRTTALVGSPVAKSTLDLAVALVAFGAVYPFVNGRWSLHRFVRFVAITAVMFFAFSFVGFFVLVPLSGISTASELLQFGIVAVSLAGAGAVSMLGDW